jgi:hypothetical protein
MKFNSAANTIWLVSLCLILAAILLASGAGPISTTLVVAGFLIMVIGPRRALVKSRAARGKSDSVVASLHDVVELGARGWLITLASAVIGGAFAITGVLLA